MTCRRSARRVTPLAVARAKTRRNTAKSTAKKERSGGPPACRRQRVSNCRWVYKGSNKMSGFSFFALLRTRNATCGKIPSFIQRVIASESRQRDERRNLFPDGPVPIATIRDPHNRAPDEIATSPTPPGRGRLLAMTLKCTKPTENCRVTRLSSTDARPGRTSHTEQRGTPTETPSTLHKFCRPVAHPLGGFLLSRRTQQSSPTSEQCGTRTETPSTHR